MNVLRIYHDAFRYALSDAEVIIVIGVVLLMNSIVNKYFDNLSMFHLSNIIILVAIGYGSMVSMHTIRGSDSLPKIRNIKRIVWEGIKKSLIIAFYTIFLSYLFHHAKTYYLNGNWLLFVICAIFLL